MYMSELVVEEGEKILPAVAKGPCDTAQLPKYVTAQYLTLKHALSCKYKTLKSEYLWFFKFCKSFS